MISDWGTFLVLLAVGIVAGTLNVLAGGGSFLTLPMLIFLGLPPSLANGTNRVGILLQNVGAVWGFRRHGVFDQRSLLWAALPATVGAIFGTWLALEISDQAFQKVLALLMVFLSLWTLWSPRPSSSSAKSLAGHPWILPLGFFLVGIYGGFIQAGIGFIILAVTTVAGLDLVRGNAVKVLAILCLTTVSLAIFAWQGKVDWALGGALAIGTVLGGQLGVRLTILKGDRFIRRVVTVMVIVFALRLWLSA